MITFSQESVLVLQLPLSGSHNTVPHKEKFYSVPQPKTISSIQQLVHYDHHLECIFERREFKFIKIKYVIKYITDDERKTNRT